MSLNSEDTIALSYELEESNDSTQNIESKSENSTQNIGIIIAWLFFPILCILFWFIIIIIFIVLLIHQI